MRRVHLIREFAPDAYEFALSSWSWIGTGGKTPRFASCFGDMFLESPEGWWFLDTVEGTLERLWASMDDMFADLEGDEGRAEYLLEETLNAALSQGMGLSDDEVFAFLPPPAVTGTMTVSSLAPLRFAIAANLAGRIHGELNGVQPDAGASALFAAHKTFDVPNPEVDRWAPSGQAGTGSYPASRPTPAPSSAGTVAGSAYEPQYAAGSELDYGSSGAGQDVGGYAAPSSGYRQPGYQSSGYQSSGHESAGYGAAGYESAGYESGGYETAGYGGAGYGAQGAGGARSAAPDGYDYQDNSHTTDSGQFSQYIADQYNTGQVAAVDRGRSAGEPRQGGRRSYA